ncbi:MAG: class I SAM-dependent methyltransferase [Gemmataceae bacterium]|nr:class I SAM-dependent methyltransferase [Gemmataceae bacterium]
MTLFAEPRRVEKLEDCFFYHTMDLPGFGVVPGDWDLRDSFDDYVGGVDFRGKRVLDIGTASGFLSFEAEKRGAEVVSFDLADATTQDILPFKDSLFYQNYPAWLRHQNHSHEPMKNSYWLAHRLYRSHVQMYYGNIYKLPETLGQFDIVLIGSVTEHLSDQIKALASIARLAADVMVINSPVLLTDEKVAYFLSSAARPHENYTWWAYSVGVYREVLGMLGFGIDHLRTAHCWNTRNAQQEPRTTLVARRALAAEAGTGLGVEKMKSAVPAGNGEPAGNPNVPGQPAFGLDRILQLEAELAATKAKLASLESLGSATLGVARRWRRLADRHPRAFGLVKPIARSLTKLLT